MENNNGVEGERLAPQPPSRAEWRSVCVGPGASLAQKHWHEMEELVEALFGC